MGIDARGWFDFGGREITVQEVDELEAKFKRADFDVPARRDGGRWFDPHDDGENPPFVEINFGFDRYYGPEYERGPFLYHLPVLGWLRRNLPEGSRLHFGGDTVDDSKLPEWTEQREREYLDHYLTHGHAPYRRYWE